MTSFFEMAPPINDSCNQRSILLVLKDIQNQRFKSEF